MPEYQKKFCPAKDPAKQDFSCAKDSIDSPISYLTKFGIDLSKAS